jgi:CHAT domain-containing protein/tetratricopeptide (TPR) repeat protein
MRFRSTVRISVAVLCIGVAIGAHTELVPGVPIERELAGGETHVYQVTLAAGQYLHAVAEQRGIDLQIAVFAPDGKELISIDNLSAMVGAEPISVLAETQGVYRLEVSPTNKEAPKGRYELQIDELRTATPEDKTRIDAQKGLAEGRKLSAQGTAESYAKSLDKLEKALGQWQTLGDRWHAAVTLNEIATVHYSISKLEPARNEYEQVLTLWRNLNDTRGEAEALNNIGTVHGKLGDPRRALEYFTQALPLIRAAGDRGDESALLNNMAVMYSYLGQEKEALEYYMQTLASSRAARDRYQEALELHGIGLVYFSFGEYQKALEQMRQSFRIEQAIGDRHLSAITLIQLGRVFARLSDFDKAMDYYAQALPLSREVGDKSGEATSLQYMGTVYRMRGDARKALEYLDQALQISQTSKLARVETSVRMEIGAAYADLGDRPKALSYYRQAIESHRAAGRSDGETSALIQAGPLYAGIGDTGKAIESLDQALALSRSLGFKEFEAQALAGRARVERDTGSPGDARADLEGALPIIESARTDLDNQDLRASYFASNRKYYELYIDVLMQLQEAGAAFEASERARARSLLESLAETHADIRQGADPELLERERTLEQQLNATERRRMQLLNRKDRAEQVRVVEKELNGLLSDYQDLQARIRLTSPHYAALTQPRPMTLKEIQQQVLDKDTVLLEYALGDDRSYLWAVTSESIEGFELPKRAEIETSAKRGYELLKTSHRREFQRQTQLALAGLSRMLLGPVSSRIGQKRLVIVGDGALQYIPFEALPEPAAANSQPLVAEHEIVNLPSASVLALLRQEINGRKPAAKAIAMLSDPVFETDDPRVRRGVEVPAKAAANPAKDDELGQIELTRSAADSGVTRFERLPFSRKEAESVEALTTPGQLMKAVDFSANKTTATSAEIAQFRIVHFATHGLINSQHPELSGIVLSLVNEKGQPQDGFLRMHEIYNLNLGAELVVLSACQTALGKEIRGEGLMGLTRGFMYAGSPRLVASLWDVRDEATAELMNRFYQGMLKENLTPAAALRAAQVSLWKEKRWEAPYYWAPFVIQGEWR